jgi:3-hydroxybutyryl-CoA dehydratase
MNPTSYVKIGDTAEFAKTLTEADLAMFCAISGDFDPIHVDEERASRSIFGRRVAHGILSMALLSTVSAMISKRAVERGSPGISVSMGFDHIRFLKPVFIGDTLSARYTVQDIDPVKGRSRSKVEVRNQRGELVVAGEHLMKWLPPGPSAQVPA